MTYLIGKAIRPKVGGFYNLRAGLVAFIFDQTELYGLTYWRGYLMDSPPVVILWYSTGSYSPVPGASHELDIMNLTE